MNTSRRCMMRRSQSERRIGDLNEESVANHEHQGGFFKLLRQNSKKLLQRFPSIRSSAEEDFSCSVIEEDDAADDKSLATLKTGKKKKKKMRNTPEKGIPITDVRTQRSKNGLSASFSSHGSSQLTKNQINSLTYQEGRRPSLKYSRRSSWGSLGSLDLATPAYNRYQVQEENLESSWSAFDCQEVKDHLKAFSVVVGTRNSRQEIPQVIQMGDDRRDEDDRRSLASYEEHTEMFESSWAAFDFAEVKEHLKAFTAVVGSRQGSDMEKSALEDNPKQANFEASNHTASTTSMISNYSSLASFNCEENGKLAI